MLHISVGHLRKRFLSATKRFRLFADIEQLESVCAISSNIVIVLNNDTKKHCEIYFLFAIKYNQEAKLEIEANNRGPRDHPNMT